MNQTIKSLLTASILTITSIATSAALFPAAFFPAAHAAAAADPSAEESPQAVIRATSEKLEALIEQARGYADEDPGRYQNEVQALLDPVVDFRSFSRLVMASNFKRASVDQRKRFAATFKSSLVKTYANALLQFSDQDIKVLDPTRPPRDPRRPSVDMEITTAGGQVYPLSYTMGKNKAGNWQVKNIIINGINLGLTFRNQFAGAVKDPQYGGDLDKVIDAWGGLVSETEVDPSVDTGAKK